MLGYVINYGFGLVFTSEYMLLLVAGGYLVAIPPYLIAEWLSNRRSFSQCLVSPESCHDQGKLLCEHHTIKMIYVGYVVVISSRKFCLQCS